MKQGWQSKKLGEICEVLKRGISPKYLESGGICVLNQKCIRNHAVNFAPSRRHNINVKKVPNERFIQLGDVLVNSTGTGTLGRVAQIRELPSEKTTVDSHVTIVRPNKDLFHLDFFGYAMILIEEEIKNAGEGCGGQTELARSTLAERFLVRYPETKMEQKRLVALLDKAFEAIDVSIEHTKKNLQNARELFQSYLNELFSKDGNGWIKRKLREIASTQYGLSRSMNDVGQGFKIFRMGELQDGKLLDTGKMKYADIDIHEFKKYQLFPEDILFNRTNSFELVGKTGIFELSGDYCFASYLIRILPKKGIILPQLLNYLMNSSGFQESIKQKASKSINQANINATILSNEKICFPSLIADQRTIIECLNSLKKATKHLESIYQKKLTALEELKKSLLHQAFSGEL